MPETRIKVAELLAAVTEDDWEQARGGFGDPELATE